VESFLSIHQEKDLKRRHKQCGERRFADRIKAILLINSGYTFEQVAEILLMDDDTVRRYLEIFNTEGADGLMKDLYKGGFPLLSIKKQKMLTAHAEHRIYLSAKQICIWVKEQWGIEYTVAGMTNLLHRLGFSYKKPKLIPGKANAQCQKKFIALYRRIKKNKGPEDQIYFADGCHPMVNPIRGYGWIKKGTEKEIPSNTGRQRMNLNGAYNPQSGKAILIESRQINAQSTIELLEKIKKNQPAGKIIFIADNARYYRCQMINEYLKTNQRIKIKFLPSYSPNLNLIERLWHFYKRKTLYNKYYPTLSHMREATWKFFNNLNHYNKELKSLMTDNFQIIKPNFSETWLC